MRIPATSAPLTALRMKNCLEDQGLAISSTEATPGEVSVACGINVLGSGAGGGTSICACGSADLDCTPPGRSAPRAPRKATTSTARSPMTSLREGLLVDRKSTRLNSSHDQISYAVFCLKKKKKKNTA